MQFCAKFSAPNFRVVGHHFVIILMKLRSLSYKKKITRVIIWLLGSHPDERTQLYVIIDVSYDPWSVVVPPGEQHKF